MFRERVAVVMALAGMLGCASSSRQGRQASADRNDDPNLVCSMERDIGTNIATKVCHHRDEEGEAAQREANQKELQRIQQRGSYGKTGN